MLKKSSTFAATFPRKGKHVDDLLNTSSVLAFSEQQEALIAAQQQVTQRVMDNNQLLRETLRKEQENAERYKQLYEAQLAKTRQLEDRVAQLEARPTNVEGDYVETLKINKYIASGKHYKRTKLNSSNDPILPLWESNATSM